MIKRTTPSYSITQGHGHQGHREARVDRKQREMDLFV